MTKAKVLVGSDANQSPTLKGCMVKDFDSFWTPVSCLFLGAICYGLEWSIPAGLFLGTGLVSGIASALLTARDKYGEWSAEKAEGERQSRLLQEALSQDLEEMVEQALSLLELMAMQLSAAERHLDQAEQDFRDRAFSPFWDAIEAATTSLAEFNESVELMALSCAEYAERVQEYAGTAPPFPIRSDSMLPIGVATTTAERLSRIVRPAQRDFQFATIFEQHKTNRILVHGFNSLAEAIKQMTTRVEQAIGALQTEVSRMNAEIGSAVRSVGAGVAAAESARAMREDKALTELRRIRRRL